jgi:hypothetical protein
MHAFPRFGGLISGLEKRGRSSRTDALEGLLLAGHRQKNAVATQSFARDSATALLRIGPATCQRSR